MKFKILLPIIVICAVLFVVLTVCAAAEDPMTNTSLSCVGPYVGNITYGTAESGSHNAYGINVGKQTRVRQNGNITHVQFGISNTTKLNYFRVCIWRHDGDLNTTSGNFTLVSISDNLKPLITVDGMQNITLPIPIAAQEGDYIGWVANSTDGVTHTISTSTVPESTIDCMIHHGTGIEFNESSINTKFNFVSAASYHVSNKIFRINCLMNAVDTAWIGDSVISGRPVHTSYVDPATYWQPNSSMSYQWGLLTGKTYQNLGWRGQTTTEIRNRFISDAVSLHPKYVVIEGGLNDHTKSINRSVTLDNLVWMTETALSNDIKPYLVEIPPSVSYGNITDYQDWDWINAQLAAKYDNNTSVMLIHCRQYVGDYSAKGPAGNLWHLKTEYDPGDHLHYNVLGYQVWASMFICPDISFNVSSQTYAGCNATFNNTYTKIQ